MQIGNFTKFIWIVWAISAFSFAARPNAYAQLGVMLFGAILCILIISGFITGIIRVAKIGLRVFLPPVISLLVLISAVYLGFGARHLIFKWKLPQYQLAAEWVEKQTFDSESYYMNLNPPEQFKSLTYSIHAQRNETCGTVIWFYWGGGFPVKHTVRIFSSIDSLAKPDCLGDWKRPRKLAEHWYEASD